MDKEQVYEKERELLAHCLEVANSLSLYINDLDDNRGKDKASAFTLPMLYGIASALDGAMRSVEFYYDLRVIGEPREN